jgi:RimJ/RimL family protein N-acetyltransferase
MQTNSQLQGERYFIGDSWLSKCLSVNCYKFQYPEKNESVCMPNDSTLFITAKLDLSQNHLYLMLLDEGFREINQQISYQKVLSQGDLQTSFSNSIPSTCKIKIHSSIPQVKRFSELFVYDRFSADKELPEGWSGLIKQSWMLSEDPNRRFVVAYSEGEIAGFVLFNTAKDCVIELVCLLKPFRGKGLAKAMLHSLQVLAFTEEIYTLRVGTQKNNIDSMHLYQYFGFIAESEKIVLHFSRGLK